MHFHCLLCPSMCFWYLDLTWRIVGAQWMNEWDLPPWVHQFGSYGLRSLTAKEGSQRSVSAWRRSCPLTKTSLVIPSGMWCAQYYLLKLLRKSSIKTISSDKALKILLLMLYSKVSALPCGSLRDAFLHDSELRLATHLPAARGKTGSTQVEARVEGASCST